MTENRLNAGRDCRYRAAMTLRIPAEWAPHERVWIGFPHDREEWPVDTFDLAREQIATFADAVADHGRGERVDLIVNDDESAEVAQRLVNRHVNICKLPIGDIWLRDTAPIIVGSGIERRARNFGFNGWGGKFLMAGDAELGERLARSFGFQRDSRDWVLEGGAIDVDGSGLAVTTEQCVLNPNRNPCMTRDDVERRLAADLGIDRVLWLGDGLAGDHTDGHVDNLARFVDPARLLLPTANGSDDPNAAVYADASARANVFGIEVITLPSPGLIEQDGIPVPASYMNFYIGNTVVAVPQYGVAADATAIETLARLFPDRRVIGLMSDAILTGGGSFHCASQQVPA